MLSAIRPETKSSQLSDNFFIRSGNSVSTENFSRQIATAVSLLEKELRNSPKAGAGDSPAALVKMVENFHLTNPIGIDLQSLLKYQIPNLVKHSVNVHDTHCAAHLHCPVLVSSIVAELIIATLNQSMDSWDQAPIATHIEEATVRWLGDLVGFSTSSDGAFTSGGTQSNLIGLMLARDHVMARAQQGMYSVKTNGLNHDWERYRIFCSNAAHFSVSKSCALLGLGHRAIVKIKTDTNGCMCIKDLKAQLRECHTQHQIPMAIVATAGTTDSGAIDPIDKIAEISSHQNIWLHVDAAYGGALLLSKHADRLNGINQADSITIDFHKMFFQNISCSAYLVKDKNTMAPLCHHADYLSREDDEEPNLVDKSLATTRRFDALKVWLSLQHLGTKNYGELIDHLLTLTRYTAREIELHSVLQLQAKPHISTLIFSVLQNQEDPSAFHKKLRQHLLISGKAVIAQTAIDGHIYLKLTLLNPTATESDMSALIHLIADTAQELVEGSL